MTKQVGRAPGVLDAITKAGVDGYVAVDMGCARPIAANGHNLGHIGHLVQVAAAEGGEAMAMQPDYWTVFSANKAEEASAAAARLGRVQDLLVRVFAPGDEFYPGHEGGVPVDRLPAMIDHIAGLPGVRFAGLTTFPALLFDPASASALTTQYGDHVSGRGGCPTAPWAQRIPQRSRSTPRALRPPPVLAQLAEAGATQVEPGHGLTGTTPLHAVSDLPEQPAVCYVSEIAHIYQGTPFCFGGGLYIDPVFGDYQTTAVVARDPGEAATKPMAVDMPDPAAIDYYAKLRPRSGAPCQRGRHRGLRIPHSSVRNPGLCGRRDRRALRGGVGGRCLGRARQLGGLEGRPMSGSPADSAEQTPALAAIGISKSFLGSAGPRDVSIELYHGRVTALLATMAPGNRHW